MYYIYVYNAYKKNFVDIQDFQNVISSINMWNEKLYIHTLSIYLGINLKLSFFKHLVAANIVRF